MGSFSFSGICDDLVSRAVLVWAEGVEMVSLCVARHTVMVFCIGDRPPLPCPDCGLINVLQ